MLELRDIWMSYEGQPLLNGVSLRVTAGETVCLLGSSGSGKSTLLRIIAGLEIPQSGSVFWNGQNMAGVPVHHRNFGLMFQDYALFPHKTVAENVAFGLQMQKLSRDEVSKRTFQALEKVNMTAFINRRVTDLSGGEQQRVALARAMAPQPRLLMLDEPLGALDRTLREQLGEELRQVLSMAGIPVIYVTHDQEEAFTLADRLVLLNQGKVVQEGAPRQVYQEPSSAWVAHFLGQTNLVSGKVINLSPIQVETSLGKITLTADSIMKLQVGMEVDLVLHPWKAYLSEFPNVDGFSLRGVVKDVTFRPEGFRTRFVCGAGIALEFFLQQALESGREYFLTLPPDGIRCLPGE